MAAIANDPKPTVPIVDFADFRADADPGTRMKIAQKLVAASRDVGFVYITNYGVPDDVLAKAFEISKKYFDLPQDQKMKAPHPEGWQVHRGYSWPGRENTALLTPKGNDMDDEALTDARAVKDHKVGKQQNPAERTDTGQESYEVGSENNPEQANVWPPNDILPEWRPFMTSFYWTCWEHSKNILRALALVIGMKDEEYLVKLHSGHYNQLRLLHYPPIPAQEIEDGTKARVASHTDWSTITLLFQDEVGGLQVEDPHHPGSFIDVEPLSGGLLMNIGDFAMRWSNGK